MTDTNSNQNYVPKNLRVDYTPVWNVPKNYLTGFIAQSRSSYIDSKASDYNRQQADADMALLAYTTTELSAMVKQGDKIILIVPVALATLELSPFRNNFIQYARTIPEDVRSLMVLKIVNIPEGFPVHKLQDILRDPSTLMRSLIISTDMRQKKYDVLANCRIHAYSASLTDAPASETKSFEQVGRFAELTQLSKHASMLEDISNRSLLGALIGAGITYVSGSAVQTPQSSLDIIRPFNLAEVYQVDNKDVPA